MRVWCSKSLGDPMLADEEKSRIGESFRSAFEDAGAPNEMALFIRHESEGRLHCEVKIYFSPAALDVGRRVGATPCEPPSADGLGLLIGSEDAWLVLFPNHRRRG
jgi:hypothetical protein